MSKTRRHFLISIFSFKTRRNNNLIINTFEYATKVLILLSYQPKRPIYRSFYCQGCFVSKNTSIFGSKQLTSNSVNIASKYSSHLITSTDLKMSTSSNNDEVSKAIAAAAAIASSSSIEDTMPSTIFDKIIAGDIPCNKVYEDDIALGFHDVNPQAPIHILIIPKHRSGLTQLCNAHESQKDLLGHLLYVAAQVGKKECPNGYRLVINDGADAAQSVYHLHIHILGGRQMTWPPG